jgi:biotin carboxylase
VNKKILILAGSHFQIPVIESAKRLGCTVITCDNRPDNPGHKLSDVYANVSTTDIEGVEKVARHYKVDGVLAYASNPAAIPAAVVAERLGLPGSGAASVKKLGLKSEYRRLLKEMHLPNPEFIVLQHSDLDTAGIQIPFGYPVMVKPTDSSGSKGVSIARSAAELPSAIDLACRYGRNGDVVVEEYILSDCPQITGEAFIAGGDVVMLDIADQQKDKSGLVPVGAIYPSLLKDSHYPAIKDQLSKIVRSAGFRYGALNIEIRIGTDGQIYFLEVGPRSGGNFLPELMKFTVGADVAIASVKVAIGVLEIGEHFNQHHSSNGTYCYYVHHTTAPGILSAIEWDDAFRAKHVIFESLFKNAGDSVSAFGDSSDALGVALLRFDNADEARDFFREPTAKVRCRLE